MSFYHNPFLSTIPHHYHPVEYPIIIAILRLQQNVIVTPTRPSVNCEEILLPLRIFSSTPE